MKRFICLSYFRIGCIFDYFQNSKFCNSDYFPEYLFSLIFDSYQYCMRKSIEYSDKWKFEDIWENVEKDKI